MSIRYQKTIRWACNNALIKKSPETAKIAKIAKKAKNIPLPISLSVWPHENESRETDTVVEINIFPVFSFLRYLLKYYKCYSLNFYAWYLFHYNYNRESRFQIVDFILFFFDIATFDSYTYLIWHLLRVQILWANLKWFNLLIETQFYSPRSA